MKDLQRLPRLAVLIDGENISPDVADGLFKEIAKLGEARLRRIYGNFLRPQLKSWDAPMEKHTIKRIDLSDHVKGKNTSDIALVIDAIDLFHIGQFDGFCIVSSDSDFARLASRLGNRGVDVYGFGEKKTPKAFRQACHKFIYTENLRPETQSHRSAAPSKPILLKPPSAAIPAFNEVISQIKTKDGWMNLSGIGKQISNRTADFDVRAYGCSTLSDLVRKTGAFDIEKAEGGHIRIRAKELAAARR